MLQLICVNKESIEALISYWLRERQYALDCKNTQIESLKKNPKLADFWKPRVLKWTERYDRSSSAVNYLRKQIKK